MTNTKRKLSSICPQCSSRVERFIINTDCEISMCESLNCSYPFNEQSAEGLNIETPITSFIRYSKSNSKASSLSNTVALPTPDDAKSAKKARTSSYKPVSSSSTEKKQKDKLHLTKPSVSDAPKPTVAALAIATSNQHTNVLPAIATQYHITKNLEPSTASTNAITLLTPPPEADHQDTIKDISATTPPSSSSVSSVSSTSSSLFSLFGFSMPSPTNSILSDTLSQFDYNITQAPPPAATTSFKRNDPQTPPAVPGLCLPPMAAAKVAKVPSSNTPNINDYTLGDIESLLTIDNVNPPTQSEELSWMEDYNDLFM
ncbi:peptide transporter ptr2 [Mucor velutinosus]|uniref:Peptide transporter ptr2 n=1 Tax=Mucor velutinosus TaxID=708070 RepID=A0AAN7HQM1_9FUNG|nr:peptide transporter ptr2 [Mucor velutinosus]